MKQVWSRTGVFVVFMGWLTPQMGCTRPTPTTAPELAASVLTEPRQDADGLRYVEHLTGGAQSDEVLPMVVAVHGLGDRPENFVGIFDGWKYKARVILPAGPSCPHDDLKALVYDAGGDSSPHCCILKYVVRNRTCGAF